MNGGALCRPDPAYLRLEHAPPSAPAVASCAQGEDTMDAHSWVPIRWKCGPLDLEQEKRRDGFSAHDAEVLGEWCQPSSLERLAGAPVNCLVVTWGNGSSGDADQRRALAPLVAAAQSRGLAVVGWVSGTGDLRPAAEAARVAGLAAIATDSKEPPSGADVLR